MRRNEANSAIVFVSLGDIQIEIFLLLLLMSIIHILLILLMIIINVSAPEPLQEWVGEEL